VSSPDATPNPFQPLRSLKLKLGLFSGFTHEVNASQQYIGDNRQFSRDGIRELTAVPERYHEALRTGGQNG